MVVGRVGGGCRATPEKVKVTQARCRHGVLCSNRSLSLSVSINLHFPDICTLGRGRLFKPNSISSMVRR